MDVPASRAGTVRFFSAAMLALGLVVIGAVDIEDLQDFAAKVESPNVDVPLTEQGVPGRIARARLMEAIALGLAAIGVMTNAASFLSALDEPTIYVAPFGKNVTFVIWSIPAIALVALLFSVSGTLAMVVVLASAGAVSLIAYAERQRDAKGKTTPKD